MTATISSALLLGSTLLILAGCAGPVDMQAAQDPNTPGATGRTVVIGSSSTIAGNAEATYNQQKWGYGRGR
jgi:hypothetical protein